MSGIGADLLEDCCTWTGDGVDAAGQHDVLVCLRLVFACSSNNSCHW